MDELLPYYERELAFVRRQGREFAERYPKIAGRLLLSSDACEDPHVERMIQAFALLNARVARRLDDDYPQLTEALFDVLYPHYLRPFPSCSIAYMDFSAATNQVTAATTVERGTLMNTAATRGVPCTFRSAYPVTLAPVALTRAAFDPILRLPDSVRAQAGASAGATAGISIAFEVIGKQTSLAKLGVDTLRVFIDGEPSFCAALRDALFMRSVAAWVQAGDGTGQGRWLALDAVPIAAAGFGENDALIDYGAQSHPAYRLLTEYFCFPEKFNFFDVDLQALRGRLDPGCASVTLHLALAGLRSDSNVARMLGALSHKHLLLGCTPVVNLFPLKAEPIRVTHQSDAYPVIPNAKSAFAYEVHAIDSVHMVRTGAQGEQVVQFRPYYSLHHGASPENSGHYWVLRHDQGVARQSPGHGAMLSIVDIDFDPAEPGDQSLSIDLVCSNGELPTQIGYGQRGGDLFVGGSSALKDIALLRKPSAPQRIERGAGAHWRLISHLSLNHLSLSAGGVEALREMLTLYDLPRSPATQRQIAGLIAVEHRPATAWLPGNPFACMVRGVEVRLAIDEEAFVGTGIHAFAHVLDRFLGLYVHANSFVQLAIVSNKNGEALLTLPPRSGDLSLL